MTDTLTVDGASLVLRRNVLAFFQGNRYLLQDLVAHVVALVPRDASVVDLYAGAGCSRLGPPRAGARVSGRRGRPRVGRRSDRQRGGARRSRRVTSRSKRSWRRARSVPEVLIVDPPRTGMSREALDGVSVCARPRDLCELRRRDAGARFRRLVDAGYAIDAPTRSICSRIRRTWKPSWCLNVRSATFRPLAMHA